MFRTSHVDGVYINIFQYLKALLGCWGSGLYGSDEDADLVASGQTDANAAVLLETDEAWIRAEKGIGC
jgi:hypothetical protein